MTNFLYLSGKSYTGKDYSANIVAQLDSRFKIYAFADGLKQEYSELTGTNLEELYTPGVKERHRIGLKELSLQRKKEDPLYYTKRLFAKIPQDSYAVICDLRFMIEELQPIVESYKGPIFRLQAGHQVRKVRGWIPNPLVDNDRMETDLDFSAYTFWKISGGGHLYNSDQSSDRGLRSQIYELLGRLFP